VSSLSRNAVLGFIGLTLALHNAEEYFAFPAFLASIGPRLPHWFPATRLTEVAHHLPIALLLATVLPLIVIGLAAINKRQALLMAALFVEAILLVNAFAHVLTAVLLQSYVPGLITAVLINLSFGVYVLRRAVGEQWIRVQVAWQLIAAAIALHVIWHSIILWRRA